MQLINLDADTLALCREINDNKDNSLNIGYRKGPANRAPHIFRLNGKVLCSANRRDDKLLIINLIEAIKDYSLSEEQIIQMTKDLGIFNPQANDLPQPLLPVKEVAGNWFTIPGTSWVWDGGSDVISTDDYVTRESLLMLDEVLVRVYPAWVRKVHQYILNELLEAKSHAQHEITDTGENAGTLSIEKHLRKNGF